MENFNKYIGKDNANYKDGRTGSRLYSIYRSMKTRCYNQNAKNYKNYGGRGITICEQWLEDFKMFHDWALSHGYRDDLIIDRMDVNGNYEPNNCRWVTHLEQNNNARTNHIITFNGVTMTLTEWSRHFNIDRNTITARLKRGWDIERALTTPVYPKVSGR